MDEYSGFVEFFTIVAAGVGTAIGILWALIRFGCRMYRVVPAIDRLHDLFGETPVHELHKIIGDIRTAVGEFEIRQRIAERHLEIGIYVCEPTGKCTWANDYLCDAFGIDSNDMLGLGWLSAISKREQVGVHTAWKQCVADALPYRESYTVVPVDGRPEWKAVTQAWPVVRNGRVVCYVGYVKQDETTTESAKASSRSVEG